MISRYQESCKCGSQIIIVYLCDFFQGLSDLRRAILTHFFDVEKSSNVYTFNEKETNLVKRLRPLHDGKGIVMLGKDYKALTSDIGIHGDKALESTTQALQSKVLH